MKRVVVPVHLRTGAIHPIMGMGERAVGTGRRVEYKACSHRPVHVPTIGEGIELGTTWWVSGVEIPYTPKLVHLSQGRASSWGGLTIEGVERFDFGVETLHL